MSHEVTITFFINVTNIFPQDELQNSEILFSIS